MAGRTLKLSVDSSASAPYQRQGLVPPGPSYSAASPTGASSARSSRRATPRTSRSRSLRRSSQVQTLVAALDKFTIKHEDGSESIPPEYYQEFKSIQQVLASRVAPRRAQGWDHSSQHPSPRRRSASAAAPPSPSTASSSSGPHGLTFEIDVDSMAFIRKRPKSAQFKRKSKKKHVRPKKPVENKQKTKKRKGVSSKRLKLLRHDIDTLASTLKAQMVLQQSHMQNLAAQSNDERQFESDKYQKLLEELMRLKQELGAQTLQMQELQAEHERMLRERTDDLANKGTTQLQILIQERERQSNSLRNKLIEEFEAKVAHLEGKITPLEAEIARLNRENDRLKRELEKTTKEKNHFHDELLKLTAHNTALERKLKHLQDAQDENLKAAVGIRMFMNKLRKKNKTMQQNLMSEKERSARIAEFLKASQAQRKPEPKQDRPGLGAASAAAPPPAPQSKDTAELQKRIRDLEDSMLRMDREHKEELARLTDAHRRALEAAGSAMISTGADARTKELQDRIYELQDENRTLTLRTEQLEEEVKQRDGTIEKLQKRVKDLEEAALQDPVEESYINFGRMLKASFLGDYLQLETHAVLHRNLREHGSQQVLFSDYVKTYSGWFGTQKKMVLLVTDTMVHTVIPSSHKVFKSIPIAEISGLSASQRASDILVIHHVQDSDLVIRVAKRPEVIYLILLRCLKMVAKPVTLRFGDMLFAGDCTMMHRGIEVTGTEEVQVSSGNFFAPRPTTVVGMSSHALTSS